MDVLGKILGTPARVKIMRLFLVNRDTNFLFADIVRRSRVSVEMVRRELKLLSSVGFIKKRRESWNFNQSFAYGEEFENLLLGPDLVSREVVLSHFKNVGRIKLLVVSGIFIKNRDSRADLLIVGNRLKRAKIEEGIKKIEAEIGGELTYVIFDTKEFLYRLDMYDKLVRDILDFPHEAVIQAKELSTHILQRS